MQASVAQAKTLLRKSAGERLRALSADDIASGSLRIAEHLRASPAFSGADYVCVYLALPREANTDAIVASLFDACKGVCVPKVVGDRRSDMVWSTWSRPRPSAPSPSPSGRSRSRSRRSPPATPSLARTTLLGDPLLANMDLVVTPGLAFGASCRRWGRGAATTTRSSTGCRPCGGRRAGRRLCVGVCLAEQLVAEVPAEEHDWLLDHAVTPAGFCAAAGGGGGAAAAAAAGGARQTGPTPEDPRL